MTEAEKDTEKLRALAICWLAGWDAGRTDKPESSCPFPTAGEHRRRWELGWSAGVRRLPSDFATKDRMVGLSIAGLIDEKEIDAA